MTDISTDARPGAPFETAPEFMGAVMQWLMGGYLMLALDVGIRTGLVRTVREVGSGTAAELADAADLSERHVREWLSLLATVGVFSYDPTTKVFTTAPGVLDVQLPSGSAPLARFGALMPELVAAFRDGTGIPYDVYGSETLETLTSNGAAPAHAFLPGRRR